MRITINGIRFDQVSPSERKVFSFTEKQLCDATVKIRKQTKSEATVLLCTCDRIELWTLESKTSTYEPLCRDLGLSPLAWKQYSYAKEGPGCVTYLYELACGLHSPLFGEDQIISQLREAIERSRLCGCTSAVLEQLFKSAVTLAKKVQSSLKLGVADKTVAIAVRNILQDAYGSLDSLPVLVIGSSELARLVSQELLDHNVSLTMTIRDLEKADLLVPRGAQRALYRERFSYFPKVTVVISATKGLEYTVCAAQALHPTLYIDLANPADIEPAVKDLEGKRLVTLADLPCSFPEREKAVSLASSMISASVDSFFSWLQARDRFASIERTSEAAANNLLYRLYAPLSQLGLDSLTLDEMRKTLVETARKAFSHQLYENGKLRPIQKYVDLTRLLENAPPVFVDDPDTSIEAVATMEKNHYRVKRLQLGTHSGTHIDSPNHILEQGRTLDSYPVGSFSAKAYVLDCRNRERIDRALVEEVPFGVTCVVFSTGWEHFWGTAAYREDPPLCSKNAILFLQERGVVLFGFDCASCDKMESTDLPIHRQILESEGLIIENLCNLQSLAGRCVDLVALPLFVKNSDGCPARVVASYFV
ncbi:putative metal-dependent hydrolase [Sphaerochaeta pleomorpha str. Grapes]|uniref:Glutamyl-tRNA reductase n=1 Tax=Sphaerochaeta pleomorpha (strain ATCC BAA-1885 / DSM 22778 / Grapes) TaxID=158190 RepID=G8QR81_SPHPG|nr:cyclase family protein [Sphaerochaeta pleomorpha]AEV31016.1 putative metal-dependent hydrolase [Sphaerochaeta pleomorpha str. Grapes]